MENNAQQEKNMTPPEICEAMYNVLDKLADATGRQRCGYIWVMNSLIDGMKAQLLNPQPDVRIGIDLNELKAEKEQKK